MSEVEISAIAGIATATLGILAAALGAIRYLWVNDPAAARNGTLKHLAEAITGLGDAQNQHDDNANRRHREALKATNDLADAIAPRRLRTD